MPTFSSQRSLSIPVQTVEVGISGEAAQRFTGTTHPPGLYFCDQVLFSISAHRVLRTFSVGVLRTPSLSKFSGLSSIRLFPRGHRMNSAAAGCSGGIGRAETASAASTDEGLFDAVAWFRTPRCTAPPAANHFARPQGRVTGSIKFSEFSFFCCENTFRVDDSKKFKLVKVHRLGAFW